MKDANDIFAAGRDGTYHACVGDNAFHDFRTYSEGYLEAAGKLLADIIDNNNLGGRDTLVHPILYAVRHSIELAIKYANSYLIDKNLYTKIGPLSGHSLSDLHKRFNKASELDRRLAASIDGLAEFVSVLDAVDPGGQDFRYPIDKHDKQTLAGKRIVNLVAVRELHSSLKSVVLNLFQLVEDIDKERSLGSFINKLGNSAVNRPDLERLSKGLSRVEGSTQAEWDAAQKHWVKELEVSNNVYRKAVTFIKQHRQFAANMGIQIPLNALTEDVLKKLLFATRSPLTDIEVQKLYREHINNHPYEVVAEINALFYLGSIKHYSEEFELEYQRELRELNGLEGDALELAKEESFLHVASKVNFHTCLKKGLDMVGYGHISNLT